MPGSSGETPGTNKPQPEHEHVNRVQLGQESQESQDVSSIPSDPGLGPEDSLAVDFLMDFNSSHPHDPSNSNFGQNGPEHLAAAVRIFDLLAAAGQVDPPTGLAERTMKRIPQAIPTAFPPDGGNGGGGRRAVARAQP